MNSFIIFKHVNYFVLPKWILLITLQVWPKKKRKERDILLLLFWEGNRCSKRLSIFSNGKWLLLVKQIRVWFILFLGQWCFYCVHGTLTLHTSEQNVWESYNVHIWCFQRSKVQSLLNEQSYLTTSHVIIKSEAGSPFWNPMLKKERKKKEILCSEWPWIRAWLSLPKPSWHLEPTMCLTVNTDILGFILVEWTIYSVKVKYFRVLS